MVETRYIVRKCCICGHAMNIELKGDRIPANVGYFGDIFGPLLVDPDGSTEYWECAVCLEEE